MAKTISLPLRNTGVWREKDWGGDRNTKNWRSTEMTKPGYEGLWKVVDQNNINIADQFQDQSSAEQYIEYHKTQQEECESRRGPAGEEHVYDYLQGCILQTKGDVNKYGVLSIYGNGKILYDYDENFRDDGKRFDFKNLRRGEFVSSEVTGYFKFTRDTVDDDIAGKFSEKNHSNRGDQVRCYDPSINARTGRTRWRYENPHPTYTGNLGTGDNGVGLIDEKQDKWVGYKFVKKVQGENVLIEIYQDAGDNEGERPSNEWKKLASWVDDKYRRTNPPDGHNVTIRIDDPEEEGLQNLRYQWLSLQEIV